MGEALATNTRRGEAASDVSAASGMLLTDLLERALAKGRERVAIDFMGREVSYGDLADSVEHAAAALQELGVGKGTKFGLCLPNMPAYPILYFALHRIGAVVVNINPLYTAREIEHLLRDSGAEYIATCDVAEFHGKVRKLAGELGIKKVVVCPMAEALPTVKGLLYRVVKAKDTARIDRSDKLQVGLSDLLAERCKSTPVERKPDDVAVLQYTGGTTGLPKAAMLTHANLCANTLQMIEHTHGMDLANEKIMGVLPLFHVFALTTVLNFGIATGSTLVLLPRFEMKMFLSTMKRTRCTELFAVPTIYGALNKLDAAQLEPMKALKFSISGGAPLPMETRQTFEKLTGCTVVEGYGLSEASPIITCNPLDGVIKDGSCGVAFPDTVIEIRDLNDPSRLLPMGERGEVTARGPQVMKGYWNRPDDSADVFIGDALRTGDVGYLDEDGYLFLVDRIKDVILAGGYNIYPRVIEEVLYEHPAVAEAVVIGVDDPYRGQAPKAFVTLRAGQTATVEELCDFAAERLNKLERPRALEIRDSLPKTLIGKLSKKELVAEEKAKTADQSG